MTTDAQPLATNATTPANVLIGSQTRLHGRWLLVARVVWCVVVGVTVAFFVLGVPLQAQLLRTACTDHCQFAQLTAAQMQDLSRLGWSLNLYIGYFTALMVLYGLVFSAVGALIFWRKSDDWMALLVSLMLMTFGLITISSTPELVTAVYPAVRGPVLGLEFLGVVLVVLFFMLFPDGRFVPRWTRWLLPFVLLREGFDVFLPDSALGWGTIGTLLQLVEIAIGLLIQIYRYRRVSGPVQRQQTKWVVYGVSVAFIIHAPELIFATPSTSVGLTALASMVADTVYSLSKLLIPLSILIAILRFRLYDIDLLINRTLVYVPLTAILAGIFAASTTLMQKLFVALTGQASDAATVLTTLLVVAAFDPLKMGLQHLVDRRFKEARDPVKEITQFGEEVQAVVEVLDAEQLSRRFLEKTVRAFGAAGGAVYLQRNGVAPLVQHAGAWEGEVRLRMPLQHEGVEVGRLELGARKTGQDYADAERAALQLTAERIARALTLIQGL